jgi:hypothetical protein
VRSVALIAAWAAIAGSLRPAAQQREDAAPKHSTVVSTRDVNGSDAITERVVTRRSQTNGGDEVIIETYAPSIEWGRLTLTRRVRRVTTVTADGSLTVEETEALNHVDLSSPLRVVQRVVTTMRRSEDESYVIERQVFDLDVNGRLVLSRTEYSSGR